MQLLRHEIGQIGMRKEATSWPDLKTILLESKTDTWLLPRCFWKVRIERTSYECA